MLLLLLLLPLQTILAPSSLLSHAVLQEEVGALDDSVPVHYYPEGDEAVSASTSRPLDSSNKGYQLLQKMGWGGKGLGRNEHGRYLQQQSQLLHGMCGLRTCYAYVGVDCSSDSDTYYTLCCVHLLQA